MMAVQCVAIIWANADLLSNWSNSQIPECTCSISHNAPFRTEMCPFLFWMKHCGIWNRCIQGSVKLVNWTLGNIFHSNITQKANIFSQDNTFENVCKVLAALFKPHTVKFIFFKSVVFSLKFCWSFFLIMTVSHHWFNNKTVLLRDTVHQISWGESAAPGLTAGQWSAPAADSLTEIWCHNGVALWCHSRGAGYNCLLLTTASNVNCCADVANHVTRLWQAGDMENFEHRITG